MSSFFSKNTDMLLEVSDAILDLPKVSIMCASDEFFMLYLIELDDEGRKRIQDFFYVMRKYDYMTDELEKKEEMFIGVTKIFSINNKREIVSIIEPGKYSKIKKTANLKKLTKRELIQMIEKYGIHNYIATKRQKPLNINFKKMVEKIIKKNSSEYNNFLRIHFSESPGRKTKAIEKTTLAHNQSE
jgi:hypothetical protein